MITDAGSGGCSLLIRDIIHQTDIVCVSVTGRESRRVFSLTLWSSFVAMTASSSSDSLMQLFKRSTPNPVLAETGTTCLKVRYLFGIMSSGSRAEKSAGGNGKIEKTVSVYINIHKKYSSVTDLLGSAAAPSAPPVCRQPLAGPSYSPPAEQASAAAPFCTTPAPEDINQMRPR